MSKPLANPTGPTWYQELTAAWLRSLTRRGHSSRSLDTYRWLLRSFGTHIEHCRVLEPAHLVALVLYSWQDTLADQSASTRRLAATVLRGLLRWAAREETGVPPNLWLHVDPVERPAKLPRPLAPEHLAQLLEHYTNRARGLEQLRDRALFLFLLTTGSRITAALSVDLARYRTGDLVVRLKGGREHTLVPSATSAQWTEQYLAARGRDDVAALWIRIPGPHGRRRARLTAYEVNRMWERIAGRLRIPVFTSHQLRHTAATELGERDVSDTELAQHMGWRSNAMAMQYRDVRANRRRQMVDQLDSLIPPTAERPVRVLRTRRR